METMSKNSSAILLLITWMLVIPSLIVWDANASGELPESSGVVCEVPQAVKVAPFTCRGKATVMPSRDDLFYKRGERTVYPEFRFVKEIYCE